MLPLQNQKTAIMVVPQSIGTDAVTGYVDTQGADEIVIDYIGDTAAAGDVITTLKLQDGATTSAFTDLSGYVGGTDFTIPAPNTSTGDIVRFRLNRVKNPAIRRYVNISIVGDATARLTCVTAQLGRLRETPDSATESGVTTLVDGD